MGICMTNNIRLRILVQQIEQIAHVWKVLIVNNDRCNPHGTRLYVKCVIVTFVIIQSKNDRFILAKRLINR